MRHRCSAWRWQVAWNPESRAALELTLSTTTTISAQVYCLELKVGVDAVYKPLRVAAIDRFFLEMRSRFGGNPIAVTDAASSLGSSAHSLRV